MRISGTQVLTHPYLGIRLDLEPSIAKVTFAPEREDRCGIVIPDLLLLGIVPHAHANMVVTRTTVYDMRL
jgi:hypothetical protein